MRLDHTILEFIEGLLFGFAKCVCNLFNPTFFLLCSSLTQRTGLSDDHSERGPPDPIPNSEVKPLCADGSVGSPHVRVGHRQAFNYENPASIWKWGFYCFGVTKSSR